MSGVGWACLLLAAAFFVAGLVALRLRRRLELVARAEHELRGPATAIGLACRRMRHDPHTAGYADVLEAQLERLRAGLDDLAVARRGAGAGARSAAPVELAPFVRAALEPWRAKLRRCSVDWRAGEAFAVADRGRLARALGNLLANSAEHGDGDLRLRAVRVPGAVRLELRNANRSPAGGGAGAEPAAGAGDAAGVGRGRGLTIAREAARELGGRLLVHTDEAATTTVLELPEGSAAGGRVTSRARAEPGGTGQGADEERPRPGDDRPPGGGHDRAGSDLVA